jgi:cupin 2 domain-containing protein
MRSGNIFENVPEQRASEEFLTLLDSATARIERIVSTGQASPSDFWFNQDWTEWVIVLSGSARLRIEGEAAARTLRPGDYVQIPAHTGHRVEWTSADPPTVWLAVHLRNSASVWI